jgi:hypothetical protein
MKFEIQISSKFEISIAGLADIRKTLRICIFTTETTCREICSECVSLLQRPIKESSVQNVYLYYSD